MNERYTRETWLQARAELIRVMAENGFPEEVGALVAKELRSERSIRRMTGYVRNARPRSMEQLADELLAIIDDRENWIRKKEAEESSSRYNAWLDSEERSYENED